MTVFLVGMCREAFNTHIHSPSGWDKTAATERREAQTPSPHSQKDMHIHHTCKAARIRVHHDFKACSALPLIELHLYFSHSSASFSTSSHLSPLSQLFFEARHVNESHEDQFCCVKVLWCDWTHIFSWRGISWEVAMDPQNNSKPACVCHYCCFFPTTKILCFVSHSKLCTPFSWDSAATPPPPQ